MLGQLGQRSAKKANIDKGMSVLFFFVFMVFVSSWPKLFGNRLDFFFKSVTLTCIESLMSCAMVFLP